MLDRLRLLRRRFQSWRRSRMRGCGGRRCRGSQRPFDTVLVVGPRDADLAKLAIASLRLHAGTGTVFVVAPASVAATFRGMPGVETVEEGRLVPGLDLAFVSQAVERKGIPASRAGWYLQQLLKLAWARRDGASHVLVWDADTVLLRRVAFFCRDGRVHFDEQDENHPPYFAVIQRLLGLSRIPGEGSFVAEHAMLDRAIARALLDALEKGGKPFWKTILDAIPRGEPSGFSEYETYGTFAQTLFPERGVRRRLSHQRHAASRFGRTPSAVDLKRLARRHDCASFEAWDIPPGP